MSESITCLIRSRDNRFFRVLALGLRRMSPRRCTGIRTDLVVVQAR